MGSVTTFICHKHKADTYLVPRAPSLPPRPSTPAHPRIAFFPISVFGSICPSGHRLLSLLSHLTDAHVPFAHAGSVVRPGGGPACGPVYSDGLRFGHPAWPGRVQLYVCVSWSQPAAPLPPPILAPLALPAVWPPLPAPVVDVHAAVAASLFG